VSDELDEQLRELHDGNCGESGTCSPAGCWLLKMLRAAAELGRAECVEAADGDVDDQRYRAEQAEMQVLDLRALIRDLVKEASHEHPFDDQGGEMLIERARAALDNQ